MTVKEWMNNLVNGTSMSGVALVIRGPRGDGKSTFAKELAGYVGEKNTLFVQHVDRFFTGRIENKRLIVIDEPSLIERVALTPLISDKTIVIERKGQDNYEKENYTNFLFTTSGEFRMEDSDRRFLVCDLETAQLALELAVIGA